MLLANEIIEQLNQAADSNYQKFSASLIPGDHLILGVRLPILHKMAKKIAKVDWQTFLSVEDAPCFEFTMIQGLVIGYIDCDLKTRINLIQQFIPKIDNWSVCDSFVNNLKTIKNNRLQIWQFIRPLLTDENEYAVRFALVTINHYFILDDYLQEALNLLKTVNHPGYYAKMATAWAYSSCFIKFPDQTLTFLKTNVLDPFVFKKTLQKIIESKRIDIETKNLVKNLPKQAPEIF